MGKFVLGIVVIALLDVAFVAYTFVARGFGPLFVVKAVEIREPATDRGLAGQPPSPIANVEPVPTFSDRRTYIHEVNRAAGNVARRNKRALRSTGEPSREALLASYGVSPRSNIKIIKKPNLTLILYRPPAVSYESGTESSIARVFPADRPSRRITELSTATLR